VASWVTTSAMAVEVRRRSPQLKNQMASPMSSTAPATSSVLASGGMPTSRSTPRLTMTGSSAPAPATSSVRIEISTSRRHCGLK